MDIDVRQGESIERIIFCDDAFLRKRFDYEKDIFTIKAEDNGYINLYLQDIPNLIKALQKAQEVWGEK